MNPLIALLMHLMGGIFLMGMLGSAVVVIISFVEDLHELMED